MDDFIKSTWDNKAIEFKNGHEASWGDIHCINLEIENIAYQIRNNDSVLDVGCANGYSAIAQCNHHQLASMTGVDFSESMISFALENKAKSKFSDILQFSVADIRSLPFQDNTFDVVYTTRVLINLPNWEEQKTGINECIRVTRSGGKIIFSEAFWEPLINLNSIRTVAGLASLVEHDFNRYLKKEKLENYLKENQYVFECNDFSSVYYIGSRFLRELVTDYTSFSGYSNPINNDFYEIQKKYHGGNLGIQQAYILFKP